MENKSGFDSLSSEAQVEAQNNTGSSENVSEGEEKTYKLRHNKTDVQLTFDELLKNAEKGLDYDRIRPSHEFVKELAIKNGDGDVSHFIAKMKDENKTSAKVINQSPNEKAIEENFKSEVKSEESGSMQQDLNAEKPNDQDELSKAKETCRRLRAEIETLKANQLNSSRSVGSIKNADNGEKSYYSSKEWDSLDKSKKQKLIKNGKVFEFMKKWSVK